MVAWSTAGDGSTLLAGVQGGAMANAALTREQLMDRILELNPSASAEYLGGFGETALEEYLQHLQAAQAPRGRDAVWVRRPRRAAIVWRECEA